MVVDAPTMTCAEVMGSVYLAEKDSSGDVILSWSYPTSDPDTDRHVRMRCEAEMQRRENPASAWTRFDGRWFYIATRPVPPGNNGLAHVTVVSVVVQGTEFHPDKFLAAAAALAEAYVESGTPLRILEGYLSLLTVGKFAGFAEASHVAPRDAQRAVPVAALLRALGDHSVILWAAVLLKKRVLVLADSREQLQDVLSAIPALAWHRQDWDDLRPYCIDDEQEWQELAEERVYIAGVTEGVTGRDGYWDVFVDMSSQTVEVGAAAKQDFVLTSVHKEAAGVMATCVEQGASDDACISAIEETTKGLRGKLETLAGNEESGRLSLAVLQEQIPSAPLASFLFGVALAEGLADAE